MSNRRRFVTQQQAASFLGVTDRTIRNLISRGEITGFRIPGVRAVRVDLDEIQRLMSTIPATSPLAHRRQPFGPKARIKIVGGAPGEYDRQADVDSQGGER